MKNFPEFMRNPVNKIAGDAQYTKGIEGYVFDGADGSQMAYWTYPDVPDAVKSVEHVHDYDEYFVVVQGKYTVIMGGKRVPVGVGEECLIPKGAAHSGEAIAGTRTIHAFGGKRAKRVSETPLI
jgi:mannose-6-phosphate isomerase-like protein (cupin superfamily)